MLKHNLSDIHLKERKLSSPLFQSAKQAYHQPQSNTQRSATYIVLPSTSNIPEQLFQQYPICPIYIYQGKSYIFQEGDCLWKYFLAKKDSNIVLPQEELWELLGQLVNALKGLRKWGYEHRHLKEYAVRRVGAGSFKLLFHPSMKTFRELVENNEGRWYSYYLPPEQLPTLMNEQANSCVFTLGAMLLNLMNPLDFKRDIYSCDSFTINEQVIKCKLKNAVSFYSSAFVGIVGKMLASDFRDRLSLEQLLDLAAEQNPKKKKQVMTTAIKEYVSGRLEKSRERKQLSAGKEETHQHKQDFDNQNNYSKYGTKSEVINFDRGTFGDTADKQKIQFERGTFGTPTSQKVVTFGSQDSQAEENEQQHSHTHYKDYIREYYQKQINEKQAKTKDDKKERQERPLSHIQMQERQDNNNSLNNSINLSSFSIIQNSQSYNGVEQEVKQLQLKLQQFRLQLKDCLQPVNQIIDRLKYKAVVINGDIYYGELKNNRRNGLGLECFPTNEYYYGNFKDDLFHGEGFYFWNSNKYFLGIYEAGNKVEGTWCGGLRYAGRLKDNKRHGIGVCYYSNGSVYEGQWQCGKRYGYGILSQPSGQKFMGNFRFGKKWGRGSYLTDGCRINGIWQDEQSRGDVQIIYDNGNVYRGAINGQFMKQGEGEYEFVNGTHCRGVFVNDELVKGEINYRNGEKYVGGINDLRRDGVGIYYYNDGRMAKGIWKDGVFLGEIQS